MTIDLSRLQDDFERVFGVYGNMDRDYIAEIRRCHSVMINPDYTPEAKVKIREETKERVQELKRRYFEEAKAVIEKIREEYQPR